VNESKYEELLDQLWNETTLDKEEFYVEIMFIIKEAWCDGYRAGNDDAFES
jgi:hypothetical protein